MSMNLSVLWTLRDFRKWPCALYQLQMYEVHFGKISCAVSLLRLLFIVMPKNDSWEHIKCGIIVRGTLFIHLCSRHAHVLEMKSTCAVGIHQKNFRLIILRINSVNPIILILCYTCITFTDDVVFALVFHWMKVSENRVVVNIIVAILQNMYGLLFCV